MRSSLPVLVAAALLLGAPPALALDECDKSEVCKSSPWYRGDGNSKLRIRLDLGPTSLVLKTPLKKRGKLVELRFVIRF